MQHNFGWAKRPMLNRISTDLNSDLPVSLMYGGRSWVYHLNTDVMALFTDARSQQSYVATYLFDDASHHVHADKPQLFNDRVKDILKIVDNCKDIVDPLPHTVSGDTY